MKGRGEDSVVQMNGHFIHQIKQNKQQKLTRGGKTGTRHGLARQDRAWQGMARQGKARQGKARQGKARQDQDQTGEGTTTNWTRTANSRRL